MEDGKLKYRLRVNLYINQSFFGSGMAELLHLVEEKGSLREAAEKMEMSYSKAWTIVRCAEQELGFPLLRRKVGGEGGGYSQLTEQGRELLWRYERFYESLERDAADLFDQIFSGGEEDEKS